MFTQLKDLLPRVVNKHNLHRTITAAMVCEAYRQVCTDILDARINACSTPKYFHSRVLTISTKNAVSAQEIFLHKQALVDAINKRLGKVSVMEIRTVLEA